MTGPVKLWIVCAEVQTVTVHWDGSRTYGCGYLYDMGHCPGCDGEPIQPAKVQYWLAVQDWECQRWPNLCQITDGVMSAHPRLGEPGYQLYGRPLQLWRDKYSIRCPMRCRFLDSDELPLLAPTVDVLARLKTMWRAPLRSRRGEQ